ncbi:MAG: hypothetical protein GY771_03435, partial [bacterium]|nr:hypothetical protein [bacterium]
MDKRVLKLALIPLDAIGISGMWMLAFAIRYFGNELFVRIAGPLSHHLMFLPAVLLIWLGTTASLGLFKAKSGIYRIEEDIALLKTMVIAGALM